MIRKMRKTSTQIASSSSSSLSSDDYGNYDDPDDGDYKPLYSQDTSNDMAILGCGNINDSIISSNMHDENDDSKDEYSDFVDENKGCNKKCGCCHLLSSTLEENEKLDMVIREIKREYAILSESHKNLIDKDNRYKLNTI